MSQPDPARGFRSSTRQQHMVVQQPTPKIKHRYTSQQIPRPKPRALVAPKIKRSDSDINIPPSVENIDRRRSQKFARSQKTRIVSPKIKHTESDTSVINENNHKSSRCEKKYDPTPTKLNMQAILSHYQKVFNECNQMATSGGEGPGIHDASDGQSSVKSQPSKHSIRSLPKNRCKTKLLPHLLKLNCHLHSSDLNRNTHHHQQ